MNKSPLNWQEQEAPRYTSYPPAIHFSSATNRDEHTKWLQAIQPGTRVSFYVHVPFCKKLCWFCGCHTKITQDEHKVSDYAALLLQEMTLLKQLIPSNALLHSVHFGGGSPNMLSTVDLTEIMNGMKTLCSSHSLEELAIELDPRTTSYAQVQTFASLGFNRVSLGIQDFDPMVQEAIHRIQPFSMVSSLIDELYRVNLNDINFDLIYGLPLQTPTRFKDTIDKVIELSPSRIALFSYAHLPHLKKHQQMIDSKSLPSPTEKLALYHLACQQLNAQGYTTIGIDHFAKNTDSLSLALHEHTLGRNFQGYVANPPEVLIGIGASSISQFPEGYLQNKVSLTEYRNAIQKNTLASLRGWTFTREDLIRKKIIDALMCYMAVDLDKICHNFGLCPTYFQEEITHLNQTPYCDIAEVKNNRIQITTEDRMAVRLIAAVFDPRHRANSGRCSIVN
ncbi:MAG: oxygen-independent coproporphyrinogen III oxidase [Legionellales bacterium]|nr:oxygen-independent coproporphyrinogen III oxidase [Legionellales bacterium]